MTGRLHSLPILALSVHSACNCRCVMCDIWKANSEKREISPEDLAGHIDAIRALHVRRVMLTGGEPLLHSNLWRLCEALAALDIHVSLVTTGLLLEKHARDVAHAIDELVISIDGPPDVHDAIRRVRGGFDRIAAGIRAVRAHLPCPKIIARSVIQKENYARLVDTIAAVRGIGVDHVSFLAADVTSAAFNRPRGWSPARQAEIALTAADLPMFAADIRQATEFHTGAFRNEFVRGGAASLWRIHDYYAALAGLGEFPRTRCNAPWISAVLEPDGVVRPCFFHPPYAAAPGNTLEAVLNSPSAIKFRQTLKVRTNETCRRCVCTLSLPVTAAG
jgi:MoaA/NifB/PqqE/SkfB family radical SAM enzyme